MLLSDGDWPLLATALPDCSAWGSLVMITGTPCTASIARGRPAISWPHSDAECTDGGGSGNCHTVMAVVGGGWMIWQERTNW